MMVEILRNKERLPVSVSGELKSGLAFVFRGRINGGELKLKEGEIRDAAYFGEDELLAMLSRGEIYKPEYNE
jgi:NADH pyrophosphatase NudC (nudix superfamily)